MIPRNSNCLAVLINVAGTKNINATGLYKQLSTKPAEDGPSDLMEPGHQAYIYVHMHMVVDRKVRVRKFV